MPLLCIPERGNRNRFRMGRPADQIMTLATSVKFDISKDAVKEDVFYELFFFPCENYRRIRALKYPEDNFYEEASRTGVYDISLTVIKTKMYPLEQNKTPDLDIIMDVYFTNPSIGSPVFSYQDGTVDYDYDGNLKQWGFGENDKRDFKIQSKYSKFFGPFSISVQRLADGFPQGGTIGTHRCKNWHIVFGADA